MTAILSRLLEMTVTACVMIGIVLAIRMGLSRKMNPAAMIALWAMVLLRLCLPFTIASPIHLADFIPKQVATAQANNMQQTTQDSLKLDTSDFPAAQFSHLAVSVPGQPIAEPETPQAVAGPSILEAIAGFIKSIPIWSVITSIWALGTMLVMALTTRKAWLFRRKLRVCKPIADSEILKIIKRHKLNNGIRRCIQAVECDFVEAPTVFGYFNPFILLPTQFINCMDRHKLNAILLHEICHIKRQDILLNYVWLLAKAVHWFNPLVWVAYKLFQADIEICCDQMVAHRLDRRSQLVYSQSLIDSVRFARRARNPLSSVAASLFESKSKVKERVLRLVEPQKRSRGSLLVSIVLAMLMLVSCFTTACQPNPTDQPVKNKKQDSFLNNLATPGKSTDTSSPVSTPSVNIFADYTKSWSDTVQVKPHPITVNISADVVTPVAGSVPVYEVAPERMTQEQIDGFLGLFGNVQYHLNTNTKTKADYQNVILQMQKELADLPNNKNLTTDAERDQYQKELEQGIQQAQHDMQSAPDALDDVIQPKFTNQYIIARDSQPEHIMDANGKPEKPDPNAKSARQEYESTHTEAIDVKWESRGTPMTLHAEKSDHLFLNGFQFLTGHSALQSLNIIENTSDLKSLRTTYAQAKALAENAVAKLGIGYMSIVLSAKEVDYGNLNRILNFTDNTNFTDFSKLSCTDMDYVFYFTRNIGGIGETYCSNGVMFQNQYAEPWPYERLCVVADDSGITKIEWQSSGSKLGNELASDSKLMPFDQIQKIAEQQFSDGNIDFSGDSNFGESDFKGLVKMNMNIDKVVLGYARVKLSDNNGRYVLVPVWDFFGSYTAVNTMDKANPNRNMYSRQSDSVDSYMHSFLTINAIDGSVIDRSLGY
jgi:beta-lactamase regulating signal transducer with metallopeptidase domain